jgi:hypothetical protein
MSTETLLSPQRKTFLIGLAGGVVGALLLNVVLTIKNAKISPLSGYGMVNRESLIQGKAKQIAQTKVSEEELVNQLTHFIEQYDASIKDLMKEKEVLILDKSAFASVSVPDFTEEIRLRMTKTEGQKK